MIINRARANQIKDANVGTASYLRQKSQHGSQKNELFSCRVDPGAVVPLYRFSPCIPSVVVEGLKAWPGVRTEAIYEVDRLLRRAVISHGPPGTERPLVVVKRCPVAGEDEIEPFPAGPVARAGVVAPQRTVAGTPCR
jgi:hypothetical protein